MQGSSLSCYVRVRVEVKVLIECRHLVPELDNLCLELILVLLHDVDELVFFFVEVVALFTNLLVGVAWGAKETPLAVKVLFLGKLVLELFEDAVDLHS